MAFTTGDIVTVLDVHGVTFRVTDTTDDGRATVMACNDSGEIVYVARDTYGHVHFNHPTLPLDLPWITMTVPCDQLTAVALSN